MAKTKKKTKAPNKSHVETVVEGLKAAAAMFEKSPWEITKNDLLDIGVSDYCIRRAGGLDSILRATFPIQDMDLAGIQSIRAKNAYTSKLEAALGKKELLKESLADAFKSIPAVKVKPYSSGRKTNPTRQITVVLSDLHIGSDIKAEETGSLNFGRLEESRRLARIVKEVCSYKEHYRRDTTLNVLLLGDLIQNQLHDPRDGAPLAEQGGRAIHLLSQAIAQLSANFPQVRVYCNTGNHGRNTGRHHGRAVNQKWDSIETLICYGIEQSCSAMKNVEFHIPKTPYVVFDIFGKKVFATHGDSVLNVGYPGKAINTGRLETQVNRFNASLSDKDEYSVLIVGHVHTASITHLSNGAITITNGAMVPVDEYAVSIGLMETICGQYIFESVPGYPVGDCRLIQVSEADDKDASLDTIIKPWNR